MNIKIWVLLLIVIVLALVGYASLRPQVPPAIVEFVQVVEVESGAIVEVTRIVTDIIVATGDAPTVVDPPPPAAKDLIVCLIEEPESLYFYGAPGTAARTIQHALYTNYITSLSYQHQADGLVKMPSLDDGDARITLVNVQPGDLVLDASDAIAVWSDGVTVFGASGEAVSFAGEPVVMNQLVVDFAMLPTVWSDGMAVTAADSVYGFMLAANPDTPVGKRTVQRTASYEVTGDLSVRWMGLPGFIDRHYATNFWQPQPRHIFSDYSAAELLLAEVSSRFPVGDGPFRIVDWIAGERIELARNDYYYRRTEGLPFLDSLTFKFVPDKQQLLTQLLSGQCDIGTHDGLSVQDAPLFLEAEASGLLTPYFQTGSVYEHIAFGINPYGDYNNTRPDFFEDARVRQAMVMCTDRQRLVDDILYGRSQVLHSYVPAEHPLYPGDDLPVWPYDVAAANALLDKIGFLDEDGDGIREYHSAGVTATTLDPAAWDGTPFRVTLGTATENEMRQQVIQIFKENMRACGIDVDLYYLPTDKWFAQGEDSPLFGRRFDLGEFAWLTGVEPPCEFYLGGQITGPRAKGYAGWDAVNETGWSNLEYDGACGRALNSLPGTTLHADSHRAAQIIFAENLPIIPLFLRLKVAVARPDILNFNVDPTQSSDLYNIYEIDIRR